MIPLRLKKQLWSTLSCGFLCAGPPAFAQSGAGLYVVDAIGRRFNNLSMSFGTVFSGRAEMTAQSEQLFLRGENPTIRRLEIVPGICTLNGSPLPRQDIGIAFLTGPILSVEEAAQGFFIRMRVKVPPSSLGPLVCSEFQIFPLR